MVGDAAALQEVLCRQHWDRGAGRHQVLGRMLLRLGNLAG